MTAVEWLVKEIMKHDKSFTEYYGAEIEQANKMFEQQIMDAHFAPKYGCFSEQYYNEQYKR